MRRTCINRTALLCAVLSLTIWNMQAETRTVTTELLDAATPGSLLYEIANLQDGDVLTFDRNTVNTITLEATATTITKSVTIRGNGVTVSSSNAANYIILKGATAQVENVHWETRLFIRSTSSRIINCTFKPFGSNKESVYYYCETNNVNSTLSVEGCAFLTKEEETAWVKIMAYSNKTTSHVYFTSCTFVGHATNHRTVVTGDSYLPAQQSVTFTNCVLLDPGAAEATPSVNVYNITSNGYNVFQGIMIPMKNGPAWAPKDTDIALALDATELPLTFHEEIYKVTAKGAAYRHLPVTPAENEALKDVFFPEKDLSGNAIEYAGKNTHSGAWQDVYGDEGEGEAVVTDIKVNFPNVIFTDTTYLFTATVHSKDANAEQKVTWECDDTHVTLTPSGTGNIYAAFRAEGFTEETSVKVKLTAGDNGADGQPFVREFDLTLKPYVHVSRITLTAVDLPVTFGYTAGLRATVLPAGANWQELEWTVADPAVASITVEAGGDSITVKGLTEGTTTVTATAKDNTLHPVATAGITVSRSDYSNGVFIVNEDWFGVRNGSVNFLHNDGRIDYEVFRTANHTPLYSLGVTTQYGAIYGDKFYLMSKQGVCFAVANARTMELYRGFFAPGGEGRFFLGVDEHTGYVGTSNGIRIVNLDELPNVPGDHVENGKTDPKLVIKLPGQDISAIYSGGGTYSGQIATMKRVGERIFAIQQGALHVITAGSHQVETTLNDHAYVTMTQSKDGYLWLGTSGQVSGGSTIDDDYANTSNYFVRLDPWTLERKVVTLPDGIKGTSPTFGAWQADAFYGSAQENVLYWKGGSVMWKGPNANAQDPLVEIHGMVIFRYDIGTNRVDTVLDVSDMPILSDEIFDPWSMYGTAFAVDQRTDELIVTVGTYAINGVASHRNNWKILRVNPNGGQPRADDQGRIGNIIAEYPLKQQYWFPAMPVFPDTYRPEFTGAAFPAAVTLNSAHPTDSLDLINKVADADNMRASIVTTVLDGYNKSLINAFVWHDTLVVAARKTIAAGQPAESTTLTLKFNSNGHVITKDLTVTVQPGVTVPDQPGGGSIEENPFELTQQTLTLYPKQTAQLALTAPQHFSVAWYSTATSVATVTQTGLVTTLAAGTARIIARDAARGKADTCLVTVNELPATPAPSYTLSLSTSTLTLTQGERSTLAVTVTPQQAGQTPQWTSSNPSVADVTSGGVVIAVAPGTAQIRATLGAVAAVCTVTVGTPVTQLAVSQLTPGAAQLAFPASAGASYYLVHLYELRSTGSAPVLTLKVTPDGRVTLRAAAAASLAVPLSYLTPGATYAVTVETVRETGGRAEVIRTEVTAFTTPAAPVGLDAPDADAPRASCNGSTLRLERLDGYDCTLTTVGGQTVDRFRVTDVLEQRLLTLPAGIYILTAVNANRQVAFKIVVSG